MRRFSILCCSSILGNTHRTVKCLSLHQWHCDHTIVYGDQFDTISMSSKQYHTNPSYKLQLQPSLSLSSNHLLSPSSSRYYTSHMDAQIDAYSRRHQQGVTLQDLMSSGETADDKALLSSAQFMHRELPIRLAKRVRELESLPYGLSAEQPIQTVRGWYVQSFREILSRPVPESNDDEKMLTSILENIYDRHANVVPLIAAGVLMMRSRVGITDNDFISQCPFLQDFLNRFYTSRIGIRLLISQHLAIHYARPGYIGEIALEMDALEVCKWAASDARRLCEREYGSSPDIDYIGHSSTTSFVPAHLHHILFELLKNSMRAVVEAHGTNVDGTRRDQDELPVVQVVIADDHNELAIKVSDLGNGIPSQDMPRIWSYLHTTAKRPAGELIDSKGELILSQSMTHGGHGGGHAPMYVCLHAVDVSGDNHRVETCKRTPVQCTQSLPAGLGFGLPLSRVFARYWGGDLQVVSVHGYGTDAHLHLNKLGNSNLFVD